MQQVVVDLDLQQTLRPRGQGAGRPRPRQRSLMIPDPYSAATDGRFVLAILQRGVRWAMR